MGNYPAIMRSKRSGLAWWCGFSCLLAVAFFRWRG
jgi:hypothetical protein